MTYRSRLRIAYTLASLKRLRAPYGSEAYRKAGEQMNAAEALYRAHKRIPEPDIGDVYDEEARWARRQPEGMG